MQGTAPISRRTFVQALPATAALAPAIHAAEPLPSGRVRLGLIGCGGRGRELLTVFRQLPEVDVVAISDVFEPRLQQAANLLGQGDRPQKPDMVVEHERILDRRDVDAVLIATLARWPAAFRQVDRLLGRVCGIGHHTRLPDCAPSTMATGSTSS